MEENSTFRGYTAILIFCMFIAFVLGLKIGANNQERKCMSKIRIAHDKTETYHNGWTDGVSTAVGVFSTGINPSPDGWDSLFTRDSTQYFTR